MRKRIFSIIRHAFLWLFFLGLPFILFRDLFNASGLALLKNTLLSPYYWIFCGSFLLLFYLHYLYFIPKFYLKKRYSEYSLIELLLFLGFYFLKPFELMFRYAYLQKGREVKPFDPLAIDLFTVVFFLVIITGTMVVQLIRQWHLTETRALKAEAEKATAELSFLKAQINPHFLFNTLNNIYSLSVEQCPETAASIMQLSNIMRYVTDEATKDFVRLQDELACLTDYISLHRLRHGANVKVAFEVTGNVEAKAIAPMLLMTYLENAFKYGISSHENAPIDIRIAAEDDKIRFFCRNRIFARPRVIERTGVGLVNTEQRLKHLYPNRHELKITHANGLYTVNLTLQG